MIKPELLAPAGDYKSFISAVESGADAVYFGGKDFSARSFAVNLSREEIKKAIDYAHLCGVKCYAAVNTLVKDAEFCSLFDHVNFLYSEGVDAVIIQDLGVLNFCRKNWPDLHLHASTQMTAHNLNDALMLEKMGFKRVVLAREMTLKEIQEIKDKSKIEIECFVHGALCFSYSGQCLLSSMIGGRSGNRGKCAQPCRKKYELTNAIPGKRTDVSGYLLSTSDLCALDILDKMYFIDSLKIEGRMKSAAYVAGVVEKYRKALDCAAENKKISPEDLERNKKEMASLFNRGGFSHGYLLDKKPKNLIASERSKNFGIPVGEVVSAKYGLIRIKANGVNVNDGLEIWGKQGQEKNIGFRVEKITNGIISIITKDDVEVGDKVYKNYDYKLNKRLDFFSRENYRRKVSVNMAFCAKEGENILLEMNGVEVQGPKAEKAVKIKTDEDTIRRQLEKLGNTVFSADNVNVKIEGDIYIPLKDINDMRRGAAEKLERKIVNSFKRGEKRIMPDVFCRAAAQEAKTTKAEKKSPMIAVQTDDVRVLNELVNKKIGRIYTAQKIDVKKFRDNNIQIFQVLPKILRKGEKQEIYTDYDGFLVPSLGYLANLPQKSEKIADFPLNIFNNYSLEILNNLGFSGFTASLESTLEEINKLNAENLGKEALVYGYLSLMIAEHCVLHQTKYCRKKNFGIKDEKGGIFPLLADCVNCRMRILNSVPLYFTKIEDLNVDNARIIHTIESTDRILKIVDNYISRDFGAVENTTTGHYYRGVE